MLLWVATNQMETGTILVKHGKDFQQLQLQNMIKLLSPCQVRLNSLHQVCPGPVQPGLFLPTRLAAFTWDPTFLGQSVYFVYYCGRTEIPSGLWTK